jgi:iron complex transport system substrate-binding protein
MTNRFDLKEKGRTLKKQAAKQALWRLGLALALMWQPVQATPQRVVSVFLCTDEYVFRLLPRERIAALSVLAGDKHPVVSTIADSVKGIALIRPNAEEVLSKNPDLVVMYQATNPRLREHLAQAGIPILEVPWANSLADVRHVTKLLGETFGTQDRAAALLADMDARLKIAHDKAQSPPVSTLIYEPNGYATADGVTDEILNASGLSDAGVKMHPTRMGTLPVEAVVAAAPELLILNNTREGAPAKADAVLRHPALASLKDKTLIAHASLTPLLCPGPWSADAAAEFSKLGAEARALARSRTRH